MMAGGGADTGQLQISLGLMQPVGGTVHGAIVAATHGQVTLAAGQRNGSCPGLLSIAAERALGFCRRSGRAEGAPQDRDGPSSPLMRSRLGMMSTASTDCSSRRRSLLPNSAKSPSAKYTRALRHSRTGNPEPYSA